MTKHPTAEASGRTGGGAPSRANWPVLFLAVALPPTVTRAFLLGDVGVSFQGVDLLGFLSDLAASMVCAALLLGLARLSRWLVFPLLACWGLVHYANYENVLELGSILQFSHAEFMADETFLKGSAMAVSRPLLLGLGLVVVIGAGWFGLRRGTHVALSVVASLGLGGILFLWLQPEDLETLAWRQRSLWLENTAGMLASTPDRPAASFEEIAHVFQADLEGEPLVVLPNPGANVLLLALEGIPGSALRAVAAVQGVETELRLPTLDGLASENLFATNYVLHQRQTSKGLYALLAGDYPKLMGGQPKSTEYILRGGQRKCLPQVLVENGYRTLFLQGAPLAFMFKGQFMRRIGFQETLGTRAFENPIHEGWWGVDDKTLFRRALEEIQRLEEIGDPWMLTILTVGTHHPVTVPDEVLAAAGSEKGARTRAAYRYLDEALAELFAGLEAGGFLENTLVIVTADESRGVGPPNDDVTQMLSQNQGPLVVLVPSREHVQLTWPTAAIDIALSVVDYLGIDASQTDFIGRSLFRRYTTPRTLYFGNTFHRRSGFVDGDGTLVYCDEQGLAGVKYRTAPERLFGPDREHVAPDVTELAFARAVIARSMEPPASGRGILELLPPGTVYPLGVAQREWTSRFRNRATHQLARGTIFGQQHLQTEAGWTCDVKLSVRLQGRRGNVGLTHVLRAGDEILFERQLPGLSVGDRLEMSYRFHSAEPLAGFVCELSVSTHKGRGLELVFDEATLRIGPDPEFTGGAGLIGEFSAQIER